MDYFVTVKGSVLPVSVSLKKMSKSASRYSHLVKLSYLYQQGHQRNGSLST